jgi:phosphate transport system permease protein
VAIAAPLLDERTKARVEAQLTRGGRDLTGKLFMGAMLAALGLAMLVLVVLVAQVVIDGWSVLSDRLDTLLANPSRTNADEAGLFQALRGTFWIGVFVVVLAFPIGIGAAIYLEEYASDNRFTRFININIRNLAGVPSVVYGILGLAIFVRYFDGFFPSTVSSHLGRTTLVAGVTMAILVLPIVIITASEAIRAVPRPLREAGFGVGATRWEVIRTLVLPYAAPGILTGTLLSLARAVGEAAPLILIGAVQGSVGGQTGFLDPGQLSERFTAMPIIITEFAAKPSSPTQDWEAVAAASIVVLLVAVLLANAAAILLRNRYEKRRVG